MSTLPHLTVPLGIPPLCHPLSLDLGSRNKGCVTVCDCTEGLSEYRMTSWRVGTVRVPCLCTQRVCEARGRIAASLPALIPLGQCAHPHKNAAAGACSDQLCQKNVATEAHWIRRWGSSLYFGFSFSYLFFTPRIPFKTWKGSEILCN